MNIFNLELVIAAWPAVLCFYLFICWVLPMVGMTANKWKDEATGAERKRRYWSGVRWFALSFHVATFLAFTLIYFLDPYLFPGTA